MLEVVTGYSFSSTHQRFYAGGTQKYDNGELVETTYSMSLSCVECDEPLYDGDPICAPRYEESHWDHCHVNCCDQHTHERVVWNRELGTVTELS